MGIFSVEIVRQGWLPHVEAADDLCSHGAIRLQIGGVLVADGSEDYGISESALAMLRTLHSDRLRGDALAECMILHGCGTMLGFGCGLGVDWTTRHSRGVVTTTDVVRYDAAGGRDAREFTSASLVLPFADYARAIATFAETARTLFESTPKHVEQNETWPGEYSSFWSEYDKLLTPFASKKRSSLAN
jgi:CBS domain-containing protein